MTGFHPDELCFDTTIANEGEKHMKHQLLTAAAFATVLSWAVSAQAQTFTMKLSSPTVNDVTQEWMKVFKAGVEKRVPGRIKVEIYPANQLGQIPATIEGVALGTIELTAPAVGFYIGLEPRFQVLDAAGLFDSVEHAQKVLNDPAIRARLATFGDAKGVEPLITYIHSPMMLVSTRPARTTDDLRGMKLRTPGAAPIHVEPFRKLGASPVSLPLGEVLPALQTRVIDGALAGYSVFTAFKYYDVAKNVTYVPGTWAVVSGLVSRNFMKSLGPELEKIVREEAKQAESVILPYLLEDVARNSQTWTKGGGQEIKMSPGDAEKYLAQVKSVTPAVIGGNAKVKEDYEAFLAAGAKYR
jgi:TRAP-type C4-dicarboxylate transport system substrate-binding protein